MSTSKIINKTNLLIWLPFEESSGTICYDKSGNSRNGTLGTLLTRSIGNKGKSISFPTIANLSNGGGISIPLPTLTNFTICLWYFHKTISNADPYYGLVSVLSEDNRVGDNSIMIQNSGITIYSGNYIKSYTFVDNTWNFIVVGYDNSNGRYFASANGSTYGYLTRASDYISATTRYIGLRCSDNFSNNFHFMTSKISDFKMYNIVLSEKEISYLYNSKRPQ